MTSQPAAVTSRLLARRPENVTRRLDPDSRLCLLNGHEIIQALRDEQVIVLACNTRIKHVIPGIMRAAEELDAVVCFELSRRESDLAGGYTGLTPEDHFAAVAAYAAETGFTRPFFLHADHLTVAGADAASLAAVRELIAAQLAAGYTSFALDASLLPLAENAQVCAELSQPVRERGLGLEVQLGGAGGPLTSLAEAQEFLARLAGLGMRPDLLAINNGARHGHYLDGEEIDLDLERTLAIHQALRTYGVSMAQHGVSGTPLTLLGRFADHGIRKGNVGSHWQNIVYRYLPAELMGEMKKWAAATGQDLRFAAKPFKQEIDHLPADMIQAIEEEARRTAHHYLKAFRAPGTGSLVIRALG
ncbi:MAG: class II fructose-bisphosphate aldolase [Deltaproteobacteria bacterium]|nr:class II fructose-bisphosphate aldolase [Deltaproteobacteria bacterium]